MEKPPRKSRAQIATAAANTKVAIMQAAQQIVVRDGVNALTIDAVARESGVSKGGVLYHFKTKEALIQGMVDSLCSEYEAILLNHRETEGDVPGSWARAYIKSNLDPANASQENFSVGAAILAAVANNHELVGPFREKLHDWYELMAQDSPTPTPALIAALASDAMFFFKMLGLWTMSQEQQDNLVAAMLELTQGDRVAE